MADRRWHFAAAAALSLAGADVATAQRGGGDAARFGRPVDSVENRADMRLRGGAVCAYRLVPASVRKVLEAPIASDEEAKRVRALAAVSRNCFGGGTPAQPTPFRFALSEVTYRARYPEGGVPAAGGTPPASFSVAPAGVAGTPEQQAWWQLASIASCAAFADPQDVRTLIIGPRNVAEEDRRFVPVAAAIGRCVPAAVAGQLNARNFRGALADALLRRMEEGE